MKAKPHVLSIYPEAYLYQGESTSGRIYFGVFIRRQPKGTKSSYKRLLGTGSTPKEAWQDAANEITKRMMETLES